MDGALLDISYIIVGSCVKVDPILLSLNLLSSPFTVSPIVYTVFRAIQITIFLVNRVENQNEPKRPQCGGRLGSFWLSTRPTAMGGTDYNGLGL